jgi:hypothetical protein
MKQYDVCARWACRCCNGHESGVTPAGRDRDIPGRGWLERGKHSPPACDRPMPIGVHTDSVPTPRPFPNRDRDPQSILIPILTSIPYKDIIAEIPPEITSHPKRTGVNK